MLRCVAGIDSGGSKCEVLVAREDGVALSRGYCDFRDPLSGRGEWGRGRSVTTVRTALRRALKSIRCDELHIASLGDMVPLGLWRDVDIARVVLHPAAEYSAAFSLVGETSGIVTLSGTGAFVHGRTRDGRCLHLDSFGPHVGDYGSGYQIGSMGVRAAAKSRWHPRHRTLLEGALREAINGMFPDHLRGDVFVKFMADGHERADVAALAPVVHATARAGDAIALKIVQDAAGALVETVRDVVDRLAMRDGGYALIGTGGVIANLDLFWDRFREGVAGVAADLRLVRPRVPPVAGIVLSTLLGMTQGDGAALRKTLIESTVHVFAEKEGNDTEGVRPA